MHKMIAWYVMRVSRNNYWIGFDILKNLFLRRLVFISKAGLFEIRPLVRKRGY